MIKIKLTSRESPVSNLVIHVRVFKKNSSAYGNISFLKSNEDGVIKISKERLMSSLMEGTKDDIKELGISLLSTDLIKTFIFSYKKLLSITDDVIEQDLINHGFNISTLTPAFDRTKRIIKEKEEEAKDILKLLTKTNNHFFKECGLEFEKKIKIDENYIVISL